MNTNFIQDISNFVQQNLKNSTLNKEPNNQLQDVVELILTNRKNFYAIEFEEFWLEDYNLDEISNESIKLFTKNYYDELKGIRLNRNNEFDVFQPHLVVEEEEELEKSLSRVFQIELISFGDLGIDENIENVRFINSLLQEFAKENLIKIEGLMNRNVNEIDEEIMNEIHNRFFVSINAISLHAGISDMEFVKTAIIFFIFFEIFESHEKFGRVKFYLEENFPWICIEYAEMLEFIDVDNKSLEINHSIQYFSKGMEGLLKRSELKEIIRDQGFPIANFQDNLLIQDREKFDIRSAFERLFNIKREFSENFELHKNYFNRLSQDEENAINYMQQGENDQDQELEIEDVREGIEGPILDILVEIYYEKLSHYTSQMTPYQIDQFNFMIVFMSIVIQIPIIQFDLNQGDELSQRLNIYFNQCVQFPNTHKDELETDQINDNAGWSRFITLNFRRRVDNFNEIIQDFENIEEFFQDSLASGIQDIVFNYGEDEEDLDKEIKKIIIQNGLQFAMIKEIEIRPVTFFIDISFDEIEEMKKKLDIEKVFLTIDEPTGAHFKSEMLKVEEIRRTQREQRSNKIESEFEYTTQKKKKFFAILTPVDLMMEKRFNDIDEKNYRENCCQRVVSIIQNISSLRDEDEILIDNFEEMYEFIHKIETIDEEIYVKSIKYFPKLNEDEVMNSLINVKNEELLLFIGSNHVFCGSLGNLFREFEADKLVKEESEEENKMFYKSKSIKATILKYIKLDHSSEISQAKILFNKRFARVYFDFETTFDDMYDSITKKGIKEREGLNSYEQIEFAFSLIFDFKIEFKEIVICLINELKLSSAISIQNIRSNDFVMYLETSSFRLKCGIDLVKEILEEEEVLNEFIENFNLDLEVIKSLSNNFEPKEFEIFNEIYAYSYNGSKFDNHFILSAIKDIEDRGKWYEFVEYVGDQACMKILEYRNIKFCDLKLMTGGQSLKEFGIDMNIQNEFEKIDIDISKMKTYSLALKNKKEIMKYVMFDSISMRKIHRKFEKSVRLLIQHAFSEELNEQFKEEELDFKLIKNKKDIIAYLIKGYFNKWFTISSLSLQIFNDFFLKHIIQAPKDEYRYEFAKNSYQGGYTEAFAIGEIQDSKVFYYDFNSMYPSIMAKLNVPTYLNESRLIECDIEIIPSNTFEIGLIIDTDPLFEFEGFYNFQIDAGHYNLYQISKFEFGECNVPCFGLVTKKHGTIYPIRFDEIKDSDHISQDLVVFGFEIALAFREFNLKSVSVCKILQMQAKSNIQPIFNKFDEFMYNSRLEYKKEKNQSMAECIKIFINSLYGKYGEKHHDVEMIISKKEFENEFEFKNSIIDKVKKIKGAIELPELIFGESKIDNYPLFDFNDRDTDLIRIKISDLPMDNSHNGAFVYYASMITAVGRSLIEKIAIQMKGPSRVIYIDTDSIIVNEAGSNQIIDEQLAEIHNSKLGALKNEYPLRDEIEKTAIERFIVFNKKVYEYMIDGEWTNKFKGCVNVSDDMSEQFMNGECRYIEKEERFKKINGNVTIIDFDMFFKLRLSRKVIDPGEFQFTIPYEDLEELKKDYGNSSARIFFNEELEQWGVIE